MARWKARVEFLLSVIGLFLSLTVEAQQGKMCQNSLTSGVVGHLEPRFQGYGSSLGNTFGFYKTIDTFYYVTVQTAPCHVPSFWHNTGMWQTDGQTDRQTDGIAVSSTVLAMRALWRALWRAVKSMENYIFTFKYHRKSSPAACKLVTFSSSAVICSPIF